MRFKKLKLARNNKITHPEKGTLDLVDENSPIARFCEHLAASLTQLEEEIKSNRSREGKQ